MASSNSIRNDATLAERVRSRREELRLTREELVSQIEAMPGKGVSSSTIKSMEIGGYKLPRRKWGGGPSALDIVATALSVPVGYFLAAFSEDEIAASQYGHAVRTGRIALVPILRDQNEQPNSLRAFMDRLPKTEHELFELPLHSYKNQFAVAVIFQIERLYPGLEMLIVNEPPFIFWDDEDVAQWAENMNVGQNDRATFREEFKNYKKYFRDLVDKKKKSYKVVVNMPTLKRFLSRKTMVARLAVIDDMCSLVKRSNFNLVLHAPDGISFVGSLDPTGVFEAHECEVLCKTQTIPASLEGTVSIQIMASPPHQKPVGYFVGPAPIDMILIQREVGRIDNAWASSLDQYRQALNKRSSPVSQLSDAVVRNHTVSLLKSLSTN